MRPETDFDLSAHNTLGLVSHARLGGVVRDQDEVREAVRHAWESGLAFHVLGEGSNVVLNRHIDALVALMKIEGREILKSSPQGTRVTVGAGESWHGLVEWTLDNDLPGLENLAGIPGTVGAAPVQNIGAYGAELAEFFDSLVAFDMHTQQFHRYERDACQFSYRDSIFKQQSGRFVIVEVTLVLPGAWRPRTGYSGLGGLETATPVTIKDAVLALRGRKLPDWRKIGNAGSFFHNPTIPGPQAGRLREEYPDMPVYALPGGAAKLSAGWLIERCGLKGTRIGDAGISADHALVLVNLGTARQEDVAELAERVKTSVRERFGVELVQEPRWI
ncbi:UDP-N-acetylmuramate dehydrogenase [Pelagibacterium sediminicola]|uniref:UDP-N-acetylmuramate dehydrogenase n=1 Tax=Pelagibacterium sediminicola TaxID=2248761 RepID=UPI000E31AEC6|nr:UDP-N-acetylmuramate dehydrogenase [Pelagibacterium sediminicola]